MLPSDIKAALKPSNHINLEFTRKDPQLHTKMCMESHHRTDGYTPKRTPENCMLLFHGMLKHCMYKEYLHLQH